MPFVFTDMLKSFFKKKEQKKERKKERKSPVATSLPQSSEEWAGNFQIAHLISEELPLKQNILSVLLPNFRLLIRESVAIVNLNLKVLHTFPKLSNYFRLGPLSPFPLSSESCFNDNFGRENIPLLVSVKYCVIICV